MKTILKILKRPVLSLRLIALLVDTSLQLKKGKFTYLINEPVGLSPLKDNEDWRFADWLVRGICARWVIASPCLTHAVALHRIADKDAVLKLAVRKSSEISAHASIIFQAHEFTLSAEWSDEAAFAEFRKGQSYGAS